MLISDVLERETRRRRREHWLVRLSQVALAVALVAGWQVFSGDPRVDRVVLIDKFYVSEPSDIWTVLTAWSQNGEAWRHSWVTTRETIFGFAVGSALGLILGLALGMFTRLGRVISPFIAAAYSIPRLALVPLFVIWFGIGFQSKVAFVSMVVFFLVFLSTFNGTKDVDRDLIDTLHVMGARRRHIVGKVVLPAAMTWILAGLRISIPYALVAAVTAEIISSNAGLGYLLVRSSSQFYIEGVFASIVLMVTVSLTFLGLVVLLERRLLRWKFL